MYRTTTAGAPHVITAFNGLVVALDVETGAEVWRVGRSRGETMRLHVTADRVLVLSGRELLALDYASGGQIYRISLDTSGTGGALTLLVHGDRAYVSTNGVLRAFELATGKLLWRNELPGTGYGPAAIGLPGEVAQGDV